MTEARAERATEEATPATLWLSYRPSSMAHPQAYAANKGTLAPGQTISVNKYTVQVDRYLSQGQLLSMNVAVAVVHSSQVVSRTSISSGHRPPSTTQPTMFSSASQSQTRACCLR